MTINGQLIGSKKMENNKLKTYFGAISIHYQPDDIGLTISTTGVDMIHGRNKRSFSWAATTEITQDR